MIRSAIARFVVLLALATPLPSSAYPFDALYVLGDSLSDQGNLFGATTLALGPANALPAADHYFNGRFSNGPVYTDLLAQRLGLPLTPSLSGGNNFAYGGARTAYNRVDAVPLGGPFPNPIFPWSLNAEVAAFSARGVQDSNALYIVFSGANDIGDIVATRMNPATVIPSTVNGILGAVDAFRLAGAKTILVPNIPDLGLTPAFSFLGAPATNPASIFSGQFNQALHRALDAYDAMFDLNIIQFPTYDLFNSLVSNPGLFGLSNVTTPCYSGFVGPNPSGTECSTPDRFLFWDIVHPTAAVHRILANAILVSVVPEPSTLALLLVSMLGMGWCFRTYSKGSDRHGQPDSDQYQRNSFLEHEVRAEPVGSQSSR